MVNQVVIKLTERDLQRLDYEMDRLGKLSRSETARQILHDYLNEIYERRKNQETLEQAWKRS